MNRLPPPARSNPGRTLEVLTGKPASAGIPVQSRTFDGPPVEYILSLASQTPHSLVVLTTHGRSALARWFVGSVVEGVSGGERSCPRHPPSTQPALCCSESLPYWPRPRCSQRSTRKIASISAKPLASVPISWVKPIGEAQAADQNRKHLDGDLRTTL